MAERDNSKIRAAFHAVFKSKTLGLIDTLKLSHEEVVGLAISLSAAFGSALNRQQLHAMLNTALNDARGRADAEQQVKSHMATTARSAKSQGQDGYAALKLAYPDAPDEVVAAVWLEVEDNATSDWWDAVARTIEPEDAKAALAVEGSAE